MGDLWTVRGVEYGNCNCDYGCPCQFNAPTTHGNCQGVLTGHIDEGHFGDTRLDGLNWTTNVRLCVRFFTVRRLSRAQLTSLSTTA